MIHGGEIMGIFDFITKRREKKEKKMLSESKRFVDLVKEVHAWVREDSEYRTFSICMHAVVEFHLGVQEDIERTEAHFRSMMADHPEKPWD